MYLLPRLPRRCFVCRVGELNEYELEEREELGVNTEAASLSEESNSEPEELELADLSRPLFPRCGGKEGLCGDLLGGWFCNTRTGGGGWRGILLPMAGPGIWFGGIRLGRFGRIALVPIGGLGIWLGAIWLGRPGRIALLPMGGGGMSVLMLLFMFIGIPGLGFVPTLWLGCGWYRCCCMPKLFSWCTC
jgi:hypothetical protein